MSLKQDLNPPPLTLGMPFSEEISPPPPANRPPVRQTLTQAAYSFLQGLYTRPLCFDMAWFNPGNFAVGPLRFEYPCPPGGPYRPLRVTAQAAIAPTGSSATMSLWRTTGGVASGKIADGTLFPGSHDVLWLTYYADQNFTYQDTNLFIVINTVGSIIPGGDLFVHVRW